MGTINRIIRFLERVPFIGAYLAMAVVAVPIVAVMAGVTIFYRLALGKSFLETHPAVFTGLLVCTVIALCVAQVVYTNRRIRREIYGGDAHRRASKSRAPRHARPAEPADPWDTQPETPPWEQ